LTFGGENERSKNEKRHILRKINICPEAFLDGSDVLKGRKNEMDIIS